MSFLSHKMEIRGKRLQPILEAMDDLAVAWISFLASRYAGLEQADSSVVTEITVRVREYAEEE